MDKIKEKTFAKTWDSETYDLFCDYQMRLPKSYIEKTPETISWHFSENESVFADFLATKLRCELEEGLHHYALEVKRVENSIQVRMKNLSGQTTKPVTIETIAPLFPEVHLALGKTANAIRAAKGG